MNTKMKKGIYAVYFPAMLIFAILQISVMCDAIYIVDENGWYKNVPISIATVSFICVSVLFRCVLAIPETRKKLRVFCTILLGINFLIEVFYTVNAYAGFIGSSTSGDFEWTFKYITAVIPAVAAIGALLIEKDSFDLDNKAGIILALTKAAEIIMIVLMTIVLCALLLHNNDTVQSIASTVMICFAVSLTTLASRLVRNGIKVTICIASWLVMIMPVIYPIKGYWWVSGGLIDAVSVISVLGVLICSILTFLIDFNIIKKKSASTGWSCPQCGTTNSYGNFCENCGARNTEYWFCTNCGTKNHNQFCAKCGQKKEI